MITKERIIELMAEDDYYLGECMLAINSGQAATEREGAWKSLRKGGTYVTKNGAYEKNGVGFNKVDAEFLMSLAEYYADHGQFTPRQRPHALKRMPKYAGQILKILTTEMEEHKELLESGKPVEEIGDALCEKTKVLYTFREEILGESQ